MGLNAASGRICSKGPKGTQNLQGCLERIFKHITKLACQSNLEDQHKLPLKPCIYPPQLVDLVYRFDSSLGAISLKVWSGGDTHNATRSVTCCSPDGENKKWSSSCWNALVPLHFPNKRIITLVALAFWWGKLAPEGKISCTLREWVLPSKQSNHTILDFHAVSKH